MSWIHALMKMDEKEQLRLVFLLNRFSVGHMEIPSGHPGEKKVRKKGKFILLEIITSTCTHISND
jgi:hypothetical protein